MPVCEVDFMYRRKVFAIIQKKYVLLRTETTNHTKHGTDIAQSKSHHNSIFYHRPWTGIVHLFPLWGFMMMGFLIDN